LSPLPFLKEQVFEHGEKEMTIKDSFTKLYTTLRSLTADQDGQDLIEYALVVALIAFAATAGMSSVATSINSAFISIGGTLTSYTG
jgi:pilus assembly protein Flp/PilA